MQTDITIRKLSHLPPCCPNCLELMSFKGAEQTTLLRGYPLVNYKFECTICGHLVASVIQDEG